MRDWNWNWIEFITIHQKLGSWKEFIFIMGSDTSTPTSKQRRKKRKKSSWIGRENKSWYPIITNGLGNSRYHKPGSHTKGQLRTWRKYSFLHFFLNDWPGNVGAWPISCMCVLDGESIRKDQGEAQRFMFHGIGMQISVVNAVWSLCTCLDYCSYSWSTLSQEPQCHPPLSSIMGISPPLPVLPEVHFYLRMEISLVPGQTFLPSTKDWQKSFLPCAYFVPVPKRDLDAPPTKAIKLEVVWVSKFPSLFSIAATQMFTLWRPSWSFTFESCQSLSSPLPNTKTFFLVDSYSQKMRERSVFLLICLLRGCSQASM